MSENSYRTDRRRYTTNPEKKPQNHTQQPAVGTVEVEHTNGVGRGKGNHSFISLSTEEKIPLARSDCISKNLYGTDRLHNTTFKMTYQAASLQHEVQVSPRA